MLDRTKAPVFQPITTYTLPKVESTILQNKARLHILKNTAQPVVGIQLAFEAGKCQEQRTGLATIAASMMLEGTSRHTAKQIAEKVAFYGASLTIDSGNDFTIVSLYSLSKHIDKLLPLLVEILQEPTFPQAELDNMVNRAIQNLKVQQERTAYLATTKFKQEIFSKAHPYAFSPSEEDFRSYTRQDCVDFYENCIKGKHFEAYVVGDIDEEKQQAIYSYLGKLSISDTHNSISLLQNPPSTVVKIYEEQKEAVQTSIRVGRLLFAHKHPDYIPFKVLNTILGGYFGSRLMQNIREDKGFTYGISSSMVALRNGAYFVIGTDVKKENYQEALHEIYAEIKKLQDELVSEKELDNVKNYISGNFLKSLSTAFAVMDKVQDIHLYQLDEDYYDSYIRKIRAVTAKQIQELAKKYLVNLTEICIG